MPEVWAEVKQKYLRNNAKLLIIYIEAIKLYMLKNNLFLLLASLLITGSFFAGCNTKKEPKNPNFVPQNIKLSSPAFENNNLIPSKYSCDGHNVNPPLNISNTPTETKSLALIIDDPDAAVGTWTHWLIWNISPDTTSIETNSVPKQAIQGKNSWGRNEYSGPCPPSNTHNYVFKLYALDIILNIEANSTVKEFEVAIKNHVLGSDQLIGPYQRN